MPQRTFWETIDLGDAKHTTGLEGVGGTDLKDTVTFFH